MICCPIVLRASVSNETMICRPIVVRGLDPRIHHLGKRPFSKKDGLPGQARQ
jgi:hypothetical protein